MRDEEQALPECLVSVRGAVDEVVVCDTGSSDGTPDAVRRSGGRLVTTGWTDDFAAVRNAALAAVTCDWVLSIDADERLVAREPLASIVATATADGFDALVVDIAQPVVAGQAYGYTHRAPRLFRRQAARWVGRVHEQLVAIDPAHSLRIGAAAGLHLVHHGYGDPEIARRKGARNAALARRQLAAMQVTGASLDTVSRAMVDLGRSLLAAGDRQGALDAFVEARELGPASAGWFSASDFTARILLAAGEYQVASAVAEDLQRHGAPAEYCSWLTAQALAYLGRPQEAVALLDGLDSVTDVDGRSLDPALLAEFRRLARSLTEIGTAS